MVCLLFSHCLRIRAANLDLAGALAPLLIDVHDVVEPVGVQVADGVLVGHDERRVVPERLAVALLGELVPLCAKALWHQGRVRSPTFGLGPGFEGSARFHLGPFSLMSGMLDLAELRADAELARGIVLAVPLITVVSVVISRFFDPI